MKRTALFSIIGTLTLSFIIMACPRLTPKVGLRSDTRLEGVSVDEFFAAQLASSRDARQKPEEVIEAAGVGKGDVVAVPWAGAGYFLPYLSEAVGPEGVVYASEHNEKIMERLRRRVEESGLDNVRLIDSRPEAPGTPYGKADFAFVVNAMAYLDLPYSFFDNLRRGMKTGGVLVVIDWKKDAKRGPKKKLKRKKDEVSDMLESMQMEPDADYKLLEYQYFIVFKVISQYGKSEKGDFWDI